MHAICTLREYVECLGCVFVFFFGEVAYGSCVTALLA